MPGCAMYAPCEELSSCATNSGTCRKKTPWSAVAKTCRSVFCALINRGKAQNCIPAAAWDPVRAGCVVRPRNSFSAGATHLFARRCSRCGVPAWPKCLSKQFRKFTREDQNEVDRRHSCHYHGFQRSVSGGPRLYGRTCALADYQRLHGRRRTRLAGRRCNTDLRRENRHPQKLGGGAAWPRSGRSRDFRSRDRRSSRPRQNRRRCGLCRLDDSAAVRVQGGLARANLSAMRFASASKNVVCRRACFLCSSIPELPWVVALCSIPW